MNNRAKQSGKRHAIEYWETNDKTLCNNPFPIESENWRAWNAGFVEGSRTVQSKSE